MKQSFVILILATQIFHSSCSKKEHSFESFFGTEINHRQFDEYLLERIDELNIPGLSIAMINDGKVVYQNYFGYANIQEQIKVDENTIFEGASMSKSVFGFFVMQFVEADKLDLDKPLYQYLAYSDLEHDQRYKKITARMVLSHQTGMPNWRENEVDKKLRLHFEPGTDYMYSGEAFQYLAMVLKEIENTDWRGLDSIFRIQVAMPLGMNETVFVQNTSTKKHKAEPYDEDGNWIDWEDDYWDQKEKDVFGAAYSIHSTAIDFSKWMIAVMNEEILSEESYDVLLKAHSDVPGEQIDLKYTLGFMQFPFPFKNTYGHGGNNDGFTCMFNLNTRKEWGFVLFTNSEYGQQLGEELFFYLLFGDNYTLPIIGLISVLLTLSIAVGFLIRQLIRIFRQTRTIITTREAA